MKKIILFSLLLTSILYSDAKIYMGVGGGVYNETLDNTASTSISANMARIKVGYGDREAYAIEFSVDYVDNSETLLDINGTVADGPRYGMNVELIKAFDFDIYINPFVKAGFGFMETLIILGPYNLGLTFYTYFQKIARDCREEGITNDSLNLRIWSLFFLTLFMSIFSIPLIDDTRWNLIIRYGQDTYSLIFIIIDMSFAFFAYIFYLRALGMGKMSVVNSITSISVVLGIPLTLIGNIIYPGAFGVIPTELEIWVFKTIGSILVIEGIVALSITQERSYILIKMKYPYELDIMPLLKQIKGVESVAAVAGNYDYILRVKIRSIAKVYNMLVRKIEKLPAIKEITTMKIIKEWEKI